jgi:hypothetical protein
MKIEVENAQQNEQVDWTKNPQLVISDDFVVLVHKNQIEAYSDSSFIGTRLNKGTYSNAWSKREFKPFHGKITLSND